MDMDVVLKKSEGLEDVEMHYCPGCTHGIIHKLLAEVLVELDLLGDTIGVAPVGCAVFCYDYFACDMHEAALGRAPAVATGIKRALPDKTVFTYQGDGDLAAIGTAEIVHAAMRGEKITTIFVNNTNYGMTGGQMAPTTLVGQKVTTAPLGRSQDHYGSPIHVSEMLATIKGSAYIERVTVHNMPGIIRTKKAIKKAFQLQQEGAGFTLIEVLSTCPTNWGLTPNDSLTWLADHMIPEFPLGVYRDKTSEGK